MGRYNVTIRFSGGDEFKTVIETDRRDAFERAKETKEYKAFVADHFGEYIVGKEVVPIMYPPKENNFHLTNSPDREQWYYVDHEQANIRFEFRKGDITKQKVWQLHGKGKADMIDSQEAVNEISDWLQEFFPELVEKPKRYIPKEEGMADPKDNGKVPCFFKLNAEYADELKRLAKEHELSVPRFIERMIDNEKTL